MIIEIPMPENNEDCFFILCTLTINWKSGTETEIQSPKLDLLPDSYLKDNAKWALASFGPLNYPSSTSGKNRNVSTG